MEYFKKKKYYCFILVVMLALANVISAFSFSYNDEDEVEPRYKRASYVGESVELKNDQMKIVFFKRICGWAWGEIYTSDDKLMGVLDHLGEIMIRDQDIPMRLESDDYELSTSDKGESIIFNVSSLVVKEKLEGTSFENWMYYPFSEPCLTGKVTITLDKNDPRVYLSYDLTATGNYYATYIRGPWLEVGEGSFGVKKDDSIFPGVEWTINNEWSSGQDWFKDPWALKNVPHPNKVSIPLMAVSYEGDGIGLSWNPNQVASRWFNYRAQHPQPVFATPNFVERMNNSLMGIMIPDASVENHENEVVAENPFELKIGQKINFDSEIWLSKGNSLDVVTDWVKYHGLPDPGEPRWSYKETLDRVANAYNTNLWHEGEGFGHKQKPEDKLNYGVPSFLQRYVNENKGTELAKELSKKIEWCHSQEQVPKRNESDRKKAEKERGDFLLSLQREDGSFYFDPHGYHYRKDDFIVATSYIEPMGLADDTAVDITVLPATELYDIYKSTGDKKYLEAFRKALDYCMDMQRPEAGDFWETPLHAPNLFAAGHAAIAYYEGYRAFKDDKYKKKAIYWIRSVLPFTHLWENEVKMLYNTKPCLCSSDWYFANWVRDHVQWEVLNVFATSCSKGIYWDEIDTEIDWLTYHKGITNAGIRWINIHTENKWRPHNIPETLEGYKNGDYDYCYPDTHNSTTGNYGGMFIPPTVIVDNIYAILDHEEKK
ncbi:MAG: hypothetical protein PVH88_00170 [Ignavibacteria bacterium]|jgi:hypothetical protein